jgi:hypothetical protein
MTEAEFTALYVQHRAGSPPIPWGPTTADQIRDQQKLWDQLADRASYAVERHWLAIERHLQTTDPSELARRLAMLPLERLNHPLE